MSLYAAAYTNPKGPGGARPTALQIIHDESLDGKLVGKVVVITGTTSELVLRLHEHCLLRAPPCF
jgi:hypothetical protein